MNEVHARAAPEAGVGIVINCDAHRVGGFEVARYGVATARRAWLGPDAVAQHAAVGRGGRAAAAGARGRATRGCCRGRRSGPGRLASVEGRGVC